MRLLKMSFFFTLSRMDGFSRSANGNLFLREKTAEGCHNVLIIFGSSPKVVMEGNEIKVIE